MTTYNITATSTDGTTNSVVISTTANMVPGLPIQFSGTTFGGIVAGDTYYISQILSGTQITLSGTAGGATVDLATGTGVMSATFSSGGQQIISTVPPGEPLESAFTKVNVNFDQVFAAGPVGSNIQISNNTIRTLNTNGNLVLTPNGIGRIVANADIMPDQSGIRSLGSPTRQWGTVYAQYLEVSGNIAFANILVTGTVSAAGNVIGNNLAGKTLTINSIASDDSSYIAIEDGLNVFGEISAVGNIMANTFVGNGVGLTSTLVDRGSDGNNWDLITQMGVYTVNRTSWTGTTNTPLDSQVFVGLLEVKNSMNMSIEQIFYPGTIDNTNVKMQWTRAYWSGTWTPWVLMTNDGQTLSGGEFS